MQGIKKTCEDGQVPLIEELMTPEGEELLAHVTPYSPDRILPLTQSLRNQGYHPDLIALAFTQAQLRAQATTKFGPFAERMLFTRDGLEQATRLSVAVHHARRFTNAGITIMADITAGIGADSLAFGASGLHVHAVEKDHTTALIAAHNVRPFPEVHVTHGDGLDYVTSGAPVAGIYADPARRQQGKRLFDPAAHHPPLPAVWDLAARVNGALGVKVGPGINHEDIPADTEAQWVSVSGEVVEAGIWFGPLAQHRGHTALLINAEGHHHTFTAHPSNTEPEIAAPGHYGTTLIEPDGALIRAGLVADLAQRIGAQLLDPHIAYLTTDSDHIPLADGVRLGRAYQITDVLPYTVKNLRGYLRERKVGSVEIKKRGVDITPEKLRPQLGLAGPNRATVILTRVKDSRIAMIGHPL
ncbi:SAM-dependent methyltransferase [Jonesia denitrificans]|uniref:THUMP-like domain-containing protein n=1 Tax=Jonesia denitrificans (strain ATCC 14870 / DSM 20603 / BCRC 15368 / CIP 55.134 / JCM 11481 / NBRC 15587 / NCTC 10816 / Prevot 55134) TaxID=471856 RepID=C7R183_JONDD|nr:hypothetical protein Jden_0634 [Jonesia denitrificans DSM 20603]ASE08035.1 SAM-dependent methyltransferase [Jonesia denitrificans]QXB42640.1 SAM-dependent methyltransferase [Jonesia denitrificans]SQH20279.1 Uncharacterised protein [Jonesia denitrificans]